MSDFDFINYLMIDDVGRSTKNNEKLQDLRDKADYLARKTGHAPVSWYEFQQTAPKTESHTMRNILIGAAIGAVIASFGGIGFAISAAFLGGAIGAFTNTENTRRRDLVSKYEGYLDTFEQTIGHGRAYALDRMPPLVEGDQVAQLRRQGNSSLQR